jgi:ribose transport system ATP-binding protein
MSRPDAPRDAAALDASSAATADAGAPLLRMDRITKRFPGVKALSDVSFAVRPGEVHALLGENGAGKSTLMKILAGAYVADEGTIALDGERVVFSTPNDALRAGIVTIYQELNLVPQLSVAENIFLGDEPLRGGTPVIDWHRAHRRSRELLGRVNLTLDTSIKVGDLGVGKQQLVEVAKALHRSARLIVMDEPTAALSLAEIDELFRVIDQLRETGVSIVYISHRLEEVFRIADRATVMRDGQMVKTVEVADSSVDELVHLMVGRALETALHEEVDHTVADEVLRVDGLTRDGVLDGVSFTVRRGEIYGLAGVMGSGRTEVARAIFGADPLDAGEVWLDGELLRLRSPVDAVAAGIALLTEDRKGQGLVLGMSVAHNVTLPVLGRLSARGLLVPRTERRLARDYVEKLSIRTPSVDQKVVNLSGGNQQKVVVAKWLASEAKLLIFDEPTRGVDVGAKAELYGLIRGLVKDGMSAVVISSDLPELLALSDRIGVMRRGRLVTELDGRTATEESVLRAAAGE